MFCNGTPDKHPKTKGKDWSHGQENLYTEGFFPALLTPRPSSGRLQIEH